MSLRALFLALITLATLSACAAPRKKGPPGFGEQWQTLRLGMTSADVRQRISTRPTSSYETDGGGHIEYWLFTRTDFADVPPAEAYVIWFDRHSKVTELREPTNRVDMHSRHRRSSSVFAPDSLETPSQCKAAPANDTFIESAASALRVQNARCLARASARQCSQRGPCWPAVPYRRAKGRSAPPRQL